MGTTLNLYLPAGYSEKLDTLAHRLDALGIDVRDKRGNISPGRAIQWLIDTELARQKALIPQK